MDPAGAHVDATALRDAGVDATDGLVGAADAGVDVTASRNAGVDADAVQDAGADARNSAPTCPPGQVDVLGNGLWCEQACSLKCDALTRCTDTTTGPACGRCPGAFSDVNADGTRCQAPNDLQILGLSPRNGAVSVPVGASVTVEFDRPLDPTQPLGRRLGLAQTPVRVVYKAGGTVVTLVPEEGLQPGRVVEVYIAKELRAEDGSLLGAPVWTRFETSPLDAEPREVPRAVQRPRFRKFGIGRDADGYVMAAWEGTDAYRDPLDGKWTLHTHPLPPGHQLEWSFSAGPSGAVRAMLVYRVEDGKHVLLASTFQSGEWSGWQSVDVWDRAPPNRGPCSRGDLFTAAFDRGFAVTTRGGAVGSPTASGFRVVVYDDGKWQPARPCQGIAVGHGSEVFYAGLDYDASSPSKSTGFKIHRYADGSWSEESFAAPGASSPSLYELANHMAITWLAPDPVTGKSNAYGMARGTDGWDEPVRLAQSKRLQLPCATAATGTSAQRGVLAWRGTAFDTHVATYDGNQWVHSVLAGGSVDDRPVRAFSVGPHAFVERSYYADPRTFRFNGNEWQPIDGTVYGNSAENMLVVQKDGGHQLFDAEFQPVGETQKPPHGAVSLRNISPTKHGFAADLEGLAEFATPAVTHVDGAWSEVTDLGSRLEGLWWASVEGETIAILPASDLEGLRIYSSLGGWHLEHTETNSTPALSAAYGYKNSHTLTTDVLASDQGRVLSLTDGSSADLPAFGSGLVPNLVAKPMDQGTCLSWMSRSDQLLVQAYVGGVAGAVVSVPLPENERGFDTYLETHGKECLVAWSTLPSGGVAKTGLLRFSDGRWDHITRREPGAVHRLASYGAGFIVDFVRPSAVMSLVDGAWYTVAEEGAQYGTVQKVAPHCVSLYRPDGEQRFALQKDDGWLLVDDPTPTGIDLPHFLASNGTHCFEATRKRGFLLSAAGSELFPYDDSMHVLQVVATSSYFAVLAGGASDNRLTRDVLIHRPGMPLRRTRFDVPRLRFTTATLIGSGDNLLLWYELAENSDYGDEPMAVQTFDGAGWSRAPFAAPGVQGFDAIPLEGGAFLGVWLADDKLMAARWNDGNWSVPTTVLAHSNPVSFRHRIAHLIAGSPHLVAGRGGTASVMAYVGDCLDQAAPCPTHELWFVHYNGNWSSPIRLDTGSGRPKLRHVSAGQGHSVVAWSEAEAALDPRSPSRVFVQTLP